MKYTFIHFIHTLILYICYLIRFVIHQWKYSDLYKLGNGECYNANPHNVAHVLDVRLD